MNGADSGGIVVGSILARLLMKELKFKDRWRCGFLRTSSSGRMLIRNLGYHSSFGGTRFVLILLPNELLEKAKPSNINILFLEALISFYSDNAIMTYIYMYMLIEKSIFAATY